MMWLRRMHVIAVLLCTIASAAVFADPNASQALSARLAQLRSIGSAGPSDLIAPSVVVTLYELRGNTLLWDESRRTELIIVLRRADLQGLDPRDYGVDELTKLPRLDGLSGDARADADIELTEALLRYVYHLRFGKVNPSTRDPNWNFPRRVRSEDPIAALAQIFSTGSLTETLGSFEPPSPLYLGLKGQLARYRAIAATGGWSPVESSIALKPGMTDVAISRLRHRLAKEGFGDADLDSQQYDEPLRKLVSAFQKQNGLEADAVVGARTRQALNTSVERRIEQIRVNLERLRWMDGARTTRFLAVNIAGFEVHLIDRGKSIWFARAQVGTPFRQTPVFTADMKYVVFNPDWTVPPTILRDDVLPAVAKDPEYLAGKHMEVIDRNRMKVDPQTIDWKQYPAAPFPYTIRQVPGPWNALGRVKFIFPNSHFVFLHDTPSQRLFARSERTFSSGCIRVEHPFDLVQLLLPGWDQSRIDQVLQAGNETTVFLPQPLPVLVVYLTALALQDGTVRFFRDVYDRDGWVSAALATDFVYHAPEGLPAN